MPRAQAHMDGSVIRPKELHEGRMHKVGELAGSFFVTGPYVEFKTGEDDPRLPNGDFDYGPGYLRAVQALLDQDERVRAGHAFKISIV